MSPWAAPIVLVLKKTGDTRLCVDFRKLNAITKKDSFPLPRIDDVLDLPQGQKYFSTLDLASGYWQIELEEESKEKTAIIVDNNLYEWNRLAFGLTNAPGTFQRLMNSVLRSVLAFLSPPRACVSIWTWQRSARGKGIGDEGRSLSPRYHLESIRRETHISAP
jgi:hypothetical protein